MDNNDDNVEGVHEATLKPKSAFVVSPPDVANTVYKHFKSSQPISANTSSKSRRAKGEMPARYGVAAPPNTHHYLHKYHSPPSPAPKSTRDYINTPRFEVKEEAAHPSPGQYYPLLPPTGPSYSFGQRMREKEGVYGKGRTSWEKAWFASNDVWKVKTNFEDKWPEIGSHDLELNCLGKRLPHLPCGPLPSFGAKLLDTAAVKRGADPSPAAYDLRKSEKLMYKASPKYTIVRKDYSYEPWIKNKAVPGPGHYAPQMPAVKPRQPAFSFAKPTPNYTVTV